MLKPVFPSKGYKFVLFLQLTSWCPVSQGLFQPVAQWHLGIFFPLWEDGLLLNISTMGLARATRTRGRLCLAVVFLVTRRFCQGPLAIGGIPRQPLLNRTCRRCFFFGFLSGPTYHLLRKGSQTPTIGGQKATIRGGLFSKGHWASEQRRGSRPISLSSPALPLRRP